MLYPNVQPFDEEREYYYSYDTMVFSKGLVGQSVPNHSIFKKMDGARITPYSAMFGFVLFEDTENHNQMYCVMVLYTWCKIRIGSD